MYSLWKRIDFRYLDALWRIIDREILENLWIFHLLYFDFPKFDWGVFRTVSTIKDEASCEKSQRFSSKMEPFTKIKPVKYFCKIIHLRCLTGFWMRFLFLVHIWEFECSHCRFFKDCVLLTHIKPPFHSYWKQIN